jgi:hypothetical protein
MPHVGGIRERSDVNDVVPGVGIIQDLFVHAVDGSCWGYGVDGVIHDCPFEAL